MRKVLVTGALGVLGRYVTNFLKERNYEVVGADLAVSDYGDYIRADVTSFEDIYRVFKKESIEIVVHMAGEVGRMLGEEHPQRLIHVNDMGTLNMVKLCLEYKSKLVFFSTSEVYGHLFDSGKPVKEADIENSSPFITTNMYALSKLFGESIVKHYVENYGLDAATVRPFMIYGEGEYPSRYRSAITNFIFNALTGRNLSVHKGAVRSWCYVSDLAEGLNLVMKHESQGRYEAYNIGSSDYHTMEEIAQIVIEETGADFDQIELVDPPSKFLSIGKRASFEKIRSLNYEPKVPVREGIRKVVKWQRENVMKNSNFLRSSP